MAGGGGLTGQRAGMASSRGFTAPANDNTVQKVTYNANGDLELEQLRIAAISANTLSSIDKTLKNTLKFEVAKAAWETRSLRELAIESSNAQAGAAGSGPGGFGFGAANAQNDNQLRPGLLGAIAGIGAAALAIKALADAFGGSGGRGGEGGSSSGGILEQMGDPRTGIGRGVQSLSDGLFAGSLAGDAGRLMPQRGGSRGPVPANDNFSRRPGALSRAAGQGRLGSEILRSSGRGIARIGGFLRSLKAGPLARIGALSAVFAAIDPIIALVESGGQVNDEVKQQVVGAIAMVLGSGVGVVAGAAIGTAVGSVVPVAGNIAGFFAGGLLGAVAGLGAEFVAEQIYDLVAGNITGSQFMRNLARGAMDGVGRVGSMALGAAAGGALGVWRAGRAAVGLAGAGGRAAGGAGTRAVAGAAPARTGGLTLAPPREIVATGVRAGLGVTAGVVALQALNPRAETGREIQITGSELHTQARQMAEQYLGRRMYDDEWEALLRATYAESGRGGGGRENAMIVATILNRARDPERWRGRGRSYGGHSVITVLFAPNQFEVCTGNNGGPVTNYVRGPNSAELEDILRSIIQFLHRVPLNQTNFTAADPRAYRGSRGLAFRQAMLDNGGVVIGGSIFNTAGPGGQVEVAQRPAALSQPATATAPTPPPQGSLFSRIGAVLSNFGRGGSAGGGAADYTPTGSGEMSGDVDQSIQASGSGWIMPTSGTISSPFRSRRRPRHNGVDIANRTGTPIVAAQDGVVEAVARERRAGLYVKIRHADGKRSLYMHLSGARVRVGDTVAKGQHIGAMGTTGVYSSGPHLHFEIRRPPGTMGHALNPAHFIPQLGRGDGTAVTAGGGGEVRPQGGRRTGGGGAGGALAGSMAGAGTIGSIGAAMARGEISMAPPEMTGDDIAARTLELERQRRQIIIQQPQAPQVITPASRDAQMRTDSGALESVASPVLAALQYATYWGVD